MNKKILCFITNVEPFVLKGVNQQETLLSALAPARHRTGAGQGENNYITENDNKGSSETTCDITYNFDEYSSLIPQHKRK